MNFKNNHATSVVNKTIQIKQQKWKFIKCFEKIFYRKKKNKIFLLPESPIIIWEKIPSGILSIIFNFLKKPKEFINFTLFLKKYIPQMKIKFRTLPQKLTKEFLDYRCYHFFDYKDFQKQIITEYFLPMNFWAEDANKPFQIFQMFVVESRQKYLFSLILYNNNTLKYIEPSPSNFKKQFYWISGEVENFPENWNQDIFSMYIKGDGTIKVINKNLNVQINIKYFEKEGIVNFFAFKLDPYKSYFKIPRDHEYYNLFQELL